GFFVGDPNDSKERDKFFNWETTRLPTVAQALALKGAYPRNYLVRPGINVTDLSLFKNFGLGGEGKRKLQLRLEAFNVFNHAQFNDMNRGVTWSSFQAYLDNQQATSTNILNVRDSSQGKTTRIGNGVAEVNALQSSVSPQRIVQLAVKIFF